MLPVLLTTSKTYLATKRVFAGCEKLLQKVERRSNFFNRICAFFWPKTNLFAGSDVTPCMAQLWHNFIQSEVSIPATFSNLICCTTGLIRTHLAAMLENKFHAFAAHVTET